MLLLLLTACADVQLKEEEKDPNSLTSLEREFFLLEKNSTVLIDAGDVLKSSGGFEVKIKSAPLKGRLETTESGLFRYEAKRDIAPGKDFALFEIKEGSKKKQLKVFFNYLGHHALPCHAGAQTDFLTIRTDTSVKLNVLQNDFFCSPEAKKLDIVEAPRNGTLTNEGLLFTYKAKEKAANHDRFVYKVSENNGNCHYAEVYLALNPTLNPCTWQLRNDEFSFKVSADSTGSEPTVLNLPIFENDELCFDKTNWDSFEIPVFPSKGSLKIDRTADGYKVGYISTFPLPLEDFFYYKLCRKEGGCQTVKVIVKIGV